MPRAAVDVDVALVTRLVRARHPDRSAPLRLVAHGWDSVILRLGQLTVRSTAARRRRAADRQRQRWLPVLAGD